jgi:actin-related protein
MFTVTLRYKSANCIVFVGVVMNHGIGRLDLGGKDLTDWFINSLEQRGHSFESKMEQENAPFVFPCKMLLNHFFLVEYNKL